ncbi:peroxiredoxin-like family protein [Lewinella sp. W8]|uniref:peroxiredoxin-like family protein n=1 Tax=Lewinella sp. W8 TaxID=2528208 RepID=UPI001068543B|nr:peroxiredoxin-like family protein [Lewinella sp. W8]MTB53546.1 redoxin domain-containing protein [Lewinella sp. W8]
MPSPNYADALHQMRTHDGRLIEAISKKRPVLLVFLRHFGCTFCREALSDLSRRKHEIDKLGGELVLVHMSTPEIAEKYFAKYDLRGVAHVADPPCRFYQGFGLTKGTARQLFGLHSWIRGFQAGVIDGHGIGKELGDGFQMPGVFVILNGMVRNQFVHKLAGERPEYVDLLASCCEVKT